MKYLLILCLFLPEGASPQVTHWHIYVNNQVVLKGSDSVFQAKPSTIQIYKNQLKADTFLQIDINEPVSNIQWVRTFVFGSENENTVLIKKFDRSNGKFSIPFSEILTKTGKEKKLHLYTEQHPVDPDSGIRSKRTLMAIMELK